jgi:hypothetical protein
MIMTPPFASMALPSILHPVIGKFEDFVFKSDHALLVLPPI